MIQPISFKSLYRYPQDGFTERQDKMAKKLEEILRSDKYTDKKGRTLEQAYDKLDINIVIVPDDPRKTKIGHEGVGMEFIEKKEPLSKALYEHDSKNNSDYIDIDDEQGIVQKLKKFIKGRKNTLLFAYTGLGVVLSACIAGIVSLSCGINPLEKLLETTQKAKEKTEVVIQKNDSIKKLSKDTLNIIKKK